MLDIEKLENLPYKEGRKAYLTNKYGSLYNVFDYRRTNKEKSAYVIADRIIETNIGKSFDMAFSYFCTKVKKHEQYIFLNQFLNYSSYNWKNYIVDGNGYIQFCGYVRPKKSSFIYSKDYKTEKVHKELNIKFDKFNPIYKKEIKTRTWLNSLGETMSYSYKSREKLLYYQYKHYKAQEKDFHEVIIQGWVKEFESKKDLEYKRLKREQIKASKKEHKNKYFKKLSDVEMRTILKAKKLKEKEETRIKLEAKGFRPNAFTNHTKDV
jgi:hypothetical protein